MPQPQRWKIFILAASYFFYGYWNWRFIGLLAISTVGNQLFAKAMHATDERGASPRAAHRRGRDEPRPARATSSTTTSSSATRATCSATSGIDVSSAILVDRAPDRDLVLHVPGAQLRHRRLPAPVRAGEAPRLRGVPVVLPAPGRRARSCAAAEFLPQLEGASRPATHRREPRVLPHRHRPVQEGGDRELPRDAHRRPRVRDAEPAELARRCSSACTRTRSRSTPTSAATPTWRSGWRCCSASGSRRTSTARTPRRRCRTSGGAGT